MPLPKEFWIQLPHRTEEELYEMLSHQADYLPEALAAAKGELSKRNLPLRRPPPSEVPKAITTQPSCMTPEPLVEIHQHPPADWRDIEGWDRYLESIDREAPFPLPTVIDAYGWESVRFLSYVRNLGGRVWFPGCGIDPGPRFYACVGCRVLATDFSPAAIAVQQRFAALTPERMYQDWLSFAKVNGPFEHADCFATAEHDFTLGTPAGEFDAVINSRAFQGLSPAAMITAARNFFAALRPGGSALFDTINVQGTPRDVIEDALTSAGFFLPYSNAERWYRNQLRNTGIVHEMVLEHPRIPYCNQYPDDRFEEYARRDGEILNSFRAEYEARLAEEELSVKAVLEKHEVKVAHVVYATG